MEEQQQQRYYPSNYGGFTQQASASSLQYQLEVQEILEDIEHNLRGEVLHFDENGRSKWKVPEGVHPLINEKGISKVMSILKARLTKIYVLSNLDEEIIENLTCGLARNVIDDLYYNWEDYDLEDDAAASLIVGLIADTVYVTLRKSSKGTYLKFLGTVHQDISHNQITQVARGQPTEEGKRGILGWLLNRK